MQGRKVVPDVDEACAEVAGWITPRLGGVGPDDAGDAAAPDRGDRRTPGGADAPMTASPQATPHCAVCGTPVASDAPRCPSCGLSRPAAQGGQVLGRQRPLDDRGGAPRGVRRRVADRRGGPLTERVGRASAEFVQRVLRRPKIGAGGSNGAVGRAERASHPPAHADASGRARRRLPADVRARARRRAARRGRRDEPPRARRGTARAAAPPAPRRPPRPVDPADRAAAPAPVRRARPRPVPAPDARRGRPHRRRARRARRARLPRSSAR